MTENAHAFEEAFNLLCDEKIGYGMSRTVFSSALLPGCVVKVEREGYFQNALEWETWSRVQYTPASRWLAECKWISPNGRVLIMERTRPAAPNELPERMPVFLTDFKRQNYGMADSKKADGKPGRQWLVCHDYGTNLLMVHGVTKRLRKADWYDA